MRVREEFRRAVADLEGLDEMLRRRVERRIGPIFRRVGVELSCRLDALTFAIVKQDWEAQHRFLGTMAALLHQAEKRRSKKR